MKTNWWKFISRFVVADFDDPKFQTSSSEVCLMSDTLERSVVLRNNINVYGEGEKTYLLAHGFGCDQTMWRFLTPQIEENTRLVLFDFCT